MPLGSLKHRTVLAVAILLCLAQAAAAAGARNRAGDFDFYVLALSWSPTYCLAAGDRAGRDQCAEGARHGFIVHGLWPQHEAGYPAYCPTRQPERVPAELGRRLIDIVPSMGLIGHMWRKHGSCSGLAQAEYLDLVRRAHARIAIPDALDGVADPATLSPEAVEAAFVAANPGLSRMGIAARCQGGRLQEVRICLTDSLDFRSCREVDAGGCGAGSLVVPPPR